MMRIRRPLNLRPTDIASLLVRLRFVGAALAALALAVVAAFSTAPPTALWLLPLAVLGVNLVLWRRSAQTPVLGNAEICLHLAGDSLALFVLLWSTGGATNPFVSFFLVPVALASVALPQRYAFAITGLCVAGYTVLLLRFLTGSVTHPGRIMGFERHIVGMWLDFVVAAALLCVFLLALTTMLRQRERELAAQREQLMRDEAIMSLATMAAGAAHALNTPLGSIVVAAEAIAEEPGLSAEAREDAATIRSQVEQCSAHLRRLVHVPDGREDETRALDVYALAVMCQWRTRRPEIDTQVTGIEALPRFCIRNDTALSQTLTNLLDNAADASLSAGRSGVAVDWRLAELAASRRPPTLIVAIDDYGQTSDLAALNRDFNATTKPTGLGLGLMLARASVLRLGGRLVWRHTPAGGTRTTIHVPLAAIRVDAAVPA